MTWTVLIRSGPNWRAIVTALSSVTASGDMPLSMMRPLIDDTLMPPPVKLRDLARQPRNVVGHLDVENADRLLVLRRRP